jgi:hypothetical protein
MTSLGDLYLLRAVNPRLGGIRDLAKLPVLLGFGFLGYKITEISALVQLLVLVPLALDLGLLSWGWGE